MQLDVPPVPTTPASESVSPLDEAVLDIHAEGNPSAPPKTFRTYGTFSCGYETMRDAWHRLEHVFSVDGPPSSTAALQHSGSRVSSKWLDQHPVDILVTDLGHAKPGKRYQLEGWLHLVLATSPIHRPKIVVESWPDHAASWENHPMTKATSQRWSDCGYSSRFKLVPTTWVGGAVSQSRLLVVRVHQEAPQWKWADLSAPTGIRPMGNLLTPPGLLPRHIRRPHKPPGPARFPHSLKDPMPPTSGSWIHTPDGTRRLQGNELLKGLGGHPSKESAPREYLLRHTTSVFTWEYLSRCIAFDPSRSRDNPELFTDWDRLEDSVLRTPEDPPAPVNLAQLDWRPPDLSKGSPWYHKRVSSLRVACRDYPDKEESIFQQGLRILDVHRDNYDLEGPALKKLQLIWWEFPKEHWDFLRDGCDMGFVSVPERVIHPNSPMDEEQVRVAAEFVDELLDIGALRELEPGESLWTNAPLFCVPKPGQPGQWRVIADCKAGGQNFHIGGDPVYLNRPLHILEQMYTGGYSAVIDVSKMFYQFPVRPEDQLFFGVVHPVGGRHLAYTGLPMGSGSSPGLAGRFGLSFVRLLREKGGMFTRKLRANCWWSSLTEDGYDPDLGYGFSLVASDGSPSVKLWVHVDDFLLHGATLDSTMKALHFFLDLTVDVGLLCHPKKLYPPAQVQRYCGFEFDSRKEPTLRIPSDKLDRCRAMAAYLGQLPIGQRISRLALSVIAGTLESVADATPNRLGHTYLRATHSLIHPGGHDPGREIYYTFARLTEDVLREMSWWGKILAHSGGRRMRSSRSGTLIPSWGDGSGTGTGGTIDLPGHDMKLWMGQWSPAVHSFSSNWKELKTLLLTLQQIASLRENPVRGATLFYFTDNSTTYWVTHAGSSTSPGLHELVEQIQLISLDLDVHLQVVHVPGLVMIQQGTDGLSRGVWVSPYHDPVHHRALNAAVFAPLQPDPDRVLYVTSRFSIPGPWKIHSYLECYGKGLFDHLSVVFPPPEGARQCIIALLEAWVERPYTTSALLFVPRVVPGFWSGLSRHLVELLEIRPKDFPMNFPPVLPIPFIVLYLAPHTRCSPSVDRRLVVPPYIKGARLHQRLADDVRGLSTGTTSE